MPSRVELTSLCHSEPRQTKLSHPQGQPVAGGTRNPIRETSQAPCFQLDINSWYLEELVKNNCTVPPEPSALSHHHIWER